MTSLTRIGNVQQRAAYVVNADLDGAFPPGKHVAICTRHTAAGVDSLTLHLEFWMLRFQNGCAAGLVCPVLETHFVIIVFDLLCLQAFMPGIGKEFAFALKIILHMAL